MSDEAAPDEELASLKRRKEKLLRETDELTRQFEAWEMAEIKTNGKTEKDFLPPPDEFEDLSTRDEHRVHRAHKKSIAFSSFITGIKFTRVEKKWISDQKYLYTANAKSKALEFSLEVTVDAENAAAPEVCDIVCEFINIRECYFIEIASWVRRFTEAKNFSNLCSAVSDYSEHNATRTKILRKLRGQSVIVSKERTEEDGGILVLLHAKDDPDFVYFEIRWVLKFVVRLQRVENCFIIQPISAGEEFLEANDELLQSFCKCGIKKNDLYDMWNKLCSAVQLDETAQSTIETSSS